MQCLGQFQGPRPARCFRQPGRRNEHGNRHVILRPNPHEGIGRGEAAGVTHRDPVEKLGAEAAHLPDRPMGSVVPVRGGLELHGTQYPREETERQRRLGHVKGSCERQSEVGAVEQPSSGRPRVADERRDPERR